VLTGRRFDHPRLTAKLVAVAVLSVLHGIQSGRL